MGTTHLVSRELRRKHLSKLEGGESSPGAQQLSLSLSSRTCQLLLLLLPGGHACCERWLDWKLAGLVWLALPKGYQIKQGQKMQMELLLGE